MIEIRGVTAQQGIMLDAMWALDDLDSLDKWMNTLSPPDREQAELLKEMIELATLDSLFDDMMVDSKIRSSYNEVCRGLKV